jgi:hypothetical protein
VALDDPPEAHADTGAGVDVPGLEPLEDLEDALLVVGTMPMPSSA